MKKLAIVALALVLAMTFVGCGAANLLVGTTWEVTEWNSVGYAKFSFEEENVCKYTYGATEAVAAVFNYSWSADGNILTIKTTTGSLYGEYEVEIKGDEMTWVNTSDEDDVIKLARVKDAE